MSRFVFASSCSMYGAAGRTTRRRGRAAAAADRLRRVEGAGRGGPPRARRRRLRAGLHAQRDGLRRLAASPLRRRPQQPVGLGVHDEAGSLIMSDGTPWRPIVHVRDIVKAAASALVAPHDARRRPGVQRRARTSENYRVSELADIVRDTFPACEVEYAEGAGTRSAELSGRFRRSSRARSRGEAASGRPATGRASCSKRLPHRSA